MVIKSDAVSMGSELISEAYFPTHIYYQDLPDTQRLNEKMLPYIYAWREEDEEGIVRSNVKALGSWHSELDMHMRDEYAEVVAQILATAQKVFNDRGYDSNSKPVIDNMWVNIHPRYGFNRGHTHPNTLWSGSYYVQAPPGSGRIYFGDPRGEVFAYAASYQPDTDRIASEWLEVYYEAIAGRIIIFPAWLRHEVEPNLSESEDSQGDRISIAFNISQRKK